MLGLVGRHVMHFVVIGFLEFNFYSRNYCNINDFLNIPSFLVEI